QIRLMLFLSEHTKEDYEFGGEDAGETNWGSSRSSENEFVSEIPVGTWFILPTPLSVPDISTLDSHFNILHLDAMEEEE
ncbi:hypothetical protein PIB30_105696, partial [Stylosanthes scabra]|nr:hypothetical protein [Stylosanthes scabra]